MALKIQSWGYPTNKTYHLRSFGEMSLPQPFESMAAVMSLVWSSFFFGMPGSYDSQKKPVDTDAMIIMIAFLAFKVHIQTSLSQVPAMFFFDVMCGCGFDTRVLSQLLGSEF